MRDAHLNGGARRPQAACAERRMGPGAGMHGGDHGELFERFVELVDRLERGEHDTESFCARHPRLADELRALTANWRRLDGLLRRHASLDARSGASEVED